MKPLIALAAGCVLLALLSACERGQDASVTPPEPLAFHSGDECHVCGMAITRFPGPKGQAFDQAGTVVRFCSVAELLSWWQQPDNRRQVQVAYVHDMANADWQSPDDGQMIDARSAYYVPAPGRKGAMGAVLATFGSRAAAEQAAQQRGQPVMDFEQVLAYFAGADQLTGRAHPH